MTVCCILILSSTHHRILSGDSPSKRQNNHQFWGLRGQWFSFKTKPRLTAYRVYPHLAYSTWSRSFYYHYWGISCVIRLVSWLGPVLRTHPNSEYTCFANSLSLLTRLPRHIRDLKNYETLLPERLAINAPREIMRLVHWMMTNHVDIVRVVPMVGESAKEHLVATIREVPRRFLRQLSALLMVATSA